MALLVGLADFQFVHPTEMETFTTSVHEGAWTKDKNDMVQPVYVTKSHTRRKRVAVPGAHFVVKAKNWSGKPTELRFEADETGRALCAVAQTDLPQLPMDADYEVRLPNGHAEHGKVRVGGNEHVRVTEIVARVA